MVGDVVKDMADNGEEILEPIACKRYSGKFMVRVPTEIHRNLPEMRPLKNAPALSFPRRRESRNIGTL